MQSLLSFFILFSLMSCQKSQWGTTTDSTLLIEGPHAIMNGKTVNSSESIASSVALISRINEVGTNEVCTGVFISKDQILTAKHCISQDRSAMSVSFRGFDYDQNLNTTDLPILSIHFFKAEGRNDLALLKVQITPELQNRPLAISPSLSFQDMEVLVVGYGVSSLTDFDSQILRKKIVQTSSIDSSQNTFMLEQANGGICFGDSGGPVVYFDSVLRKYFLVGIASGVVQGTASNPCLNQSVIMNILFYKNQIQELL